MADLCPADLGWNLICNGSELPAGIDDGIGTAPKKPKLVKSLIVADVIIRSDVPLLPADNTRSLIPLTVTLSKPAFPKSMRVPAVSDVTHSPCAFFRHSGKLALSRSLMSVVGNRTSHGSPCGTSLPGA